MSQKSPDFVDRFVDGLATAAARMKATEATPEYKHKRRTARLQAACILLIGLPIIMLAVIISQQLGWSKLVCVPVVWVAFGGSKQLGAMLASRYQGSSSVSD